MSPASYSNQSHEVELTADGALRTERGTTDYTSRTRVTVKVREHTRVIVIFTSKGDRVPTDDDHVSPFSTIVLWAEDARHVSALLLDAAATLERLNVNSPL